MPGDRAQNLVHVFVSITKNISKFNNFGALLFVSASYKHFIISFFPNCQDFKFYNDLLIRFNKQFDFACVQAQCFLSRFNV
jgi:hypothetical protein